LGGFLGSYRCSRLFGPRLLNEELFDCWNWCCWFFSMRFFNCRRYNSLFLLRWFFSWRFSYCLVRYLSGNRSLRLCFFNNRLTFRLCSSRGGCGWLYSWDSDFSGHFLSRLWRLGCLASDGHLLSGLIRSGCNGLRLLSIVNWSFFWGLFCRNSLARFRFLCRLH
jgi:hypothetical protein